MTFVLVLIMLGFSVVLGLVSRRIGASAHMALYAMATACSVLFLLFGDRLTGG